MYMLIYLKWFHSLNFNYELIVSALICLMSIAGAAQDQVTLMDYDFNGFMPQDIAVTFDASDYLFEQDYDSL